MKNPTPATTAKAAPKTPTTVPKPVATPEPAAPNAPALNSDITAPHGNDRKPASGKSTPTAPLPSGKATLKLADLVRDPAINCRAGGVIERVAAEYATAMKAGATFPHVVVFKDSGGKHLLADGFHRCRAVELAGGTEVLVEIRDGDRRAALLHAAGSNSGAMRTNADKRRAVENLLADPQWANKGDAWIALRCAVSDRFVGNLRPPTPNGSELKREGLDGKFRNAPKRKGKRTPKANPSRVVKVACRVLDRVVRTWPPGEDMTPLFEGLRVHLGDLETANGRKPASGGVES